MRVVIDGYQSDNDGTLATESLDHAVMVIVHGVPRSRELHTRMFTVGMRSDIVVGIAHALERLVNDLKNSEPYREAALFVEFEQEKPVILETYVIREPPDVKP